MDIHALLMLAIRENRTLFLDYEPGERIVEPHAYGLSSEQNGLLRAFQTTGASASGEHINWKLFRTDRIIRIELLPDCFAGPRPEYRQNDKAMRGGIFAQL